MSSVDEMSRDDLLVRRDQLEADLIQLSDALNAERAKSLERHRAIREARAAVQRAGESDAETLRQDWYRAAYQDAQQTAVVTHQLLDRYGVVASLLLECQQQLMQQHRVHRRGTRDSGN